jgi:rhodanese-related sulfurtransferase
MFMSRRFLFAVVLGLTNTVAGADEGIPTPKTLKDGKVITVEEAKTMFDKKGIVFLDTRSALIFGKGHIPGAVIVPYDMKSERKEGANLSADKMDLTKLPADKDAPLIVYSHGATGWKSYKAATYAIKSGYKNVMWMREGMEGWEARKYPKSH